MKCPFKGKLKDFCCDFGGCKPEPGAIQCPTSIFNKCQCDEDLTEDDKKFIKEFIANPNNNVG